MQPVRTPGGGRRPSQGGPQVGGGGYAWECTGELSPQHNPPKSAHSTFTSVAFHEVDNNGTFTRSVPDVTLKSNYIRIDIATIAKKLSLQTVLFAREDQPGHLQKRLLHLKRIARFAHHLHLHLIPLHLITDTITVILIIIQANSEGLKYLSFFAIPGNVWISRSTKKLCKHRMFEHRNLKNVSIIRMHCVACLNFTKTKMLDGSNMKVVQILTL